MDRVRQAEGPGVKKRRRIFASPQEKVIEAPSPKAAGMYSKLALGYLERRVVDDLGTCVVAARFLDFISGIFPPIPLVELKSGVMHAKGRRGLQFERESSSRTDARVGRHMPRETLLLKSFSFRRTLFWGRFDNSIWHY
jgi:hypothetical protein